MMQRMIEDVGGGGLCGLFDLLQPDTGYNAIHFSFPFSFTAGSKQNTCLNEHAII